MNLPSAKILSAFASEMPLTRRRFFLGVKAMLSTVLYPASASFLQSELEMPKS
jgi:hypothetical protein